MKLIRAEFKNFRLLRDLELNFSTDETKKLTVIRAENDTGKTTILNALQWALYGYDVLPGKGKDFRLYPIDWDASDEKPIPISAEVDFEIQRGDVIGNVEQYRIIRSVEETLNGARQNPRIRLFNLTNKGGKPIKDPEAWIKRELLPPELREVFFIDGDRALSFIEAAVNIKTKRKRVQEAIQSLLGLGVIEAAIGHLQHTHSQLNKDAQKVGSDKELTDITTRLAEIDQDIAGFTKKRDDAKSQREALDRSLSEIDKEIETALIKGDQEKLNLKITQTQIQLEGIDAKLVEVGKAHSELFRSLSLSRDLLTPVLLNSLGKLNELRDQGKLPSITIPVLQERLMGAICICGESLDQHSTDGKHRRHHIQQLIEESRKVDALQKSLTDLYYGSLLLQPKEIADDEHWIAEHAEIVSHRDELEELREELGKRFKALEAQLDDIGDTDIQGLRAAKQEYDEQRDRFNNDYIRHEIELEKLKEERRSLVATRNNLLTKQRRAARTLAALDVTNDVEQVLHNSFNWITNEELMKVSELMNNIFLEMIGVDPEQDAIIRKAENQ